MATVKWQKIQTAKPKQSPVRNTCVYMHNRVVAQWRIQASADQAAASPIIRVLLAMCPHQTEILDPPPPLQIPGSAGVVARYSTETEQMRYSSLCSLQHSSLIRCRLLKAKEMMKDYRQPQGSEHCLKSDQICCSSSGRSCGSTYISERHSFSHCHSGSCMYSVRNRSHPQAGAKKNCTSGQRVKRCNKI